MIKFGPSGTGESYHNEGNDGTIGVSAWLKARNLDCFEYSFGRGVNIRTETAAKIGEEFAKSEIEISVHAPYYINLASEDEIKSENNTRYFLQSLKALRAFGGKRCVFHPGSPLKQERRVAMEKAKECFDGVLEAIYGAGYNDMTVCAETMGKIAQLGTVDEIIELCNMDAMVFPCVDFGHINAREQGILQSYDDYRFVIERFMEGIGEAKTRAMHVHFSKIMYSKGGEVRHLTFEDREYGPDFEPLAKVFADFGLEPYVICESAGTQTEDAIYMKQYYNGLLAQ